MKDETETGPVQIDKMLKMFSYKHLPEPLQATSRLFHDLALIINVTIDFGPERTVALRKLLESKDAAIRAIIHAGD